MADTSGLPDVSQANFYGQPPEEQQKILDALKLGQKALEERYANPNWFNVAAGFFKPQLGGFAASLGSASGAMGDWLEKQRANEIPIAEMRARVGMMQNQMTQNEAVNKLVSESNGIVTPDLVRRAMAHASEAPATKSLVAQLATMQKERELASSEQGNALQRVQMARSMGREPNTNDLALLAAGSPTTARAPGAPTPDLGGTPTPDLGGTPKWTGGMLSAAAIDELRNKAAAGDTESAAALRAYDDALKSASVPADMAQAPAVKQDMLPVTVRMPNISDVPDPKRQELIAGSTKAHADKLEKISDERYEGLKTFTNSEYSTAAKSAAATLIRMMKKDPEAADHVLNIVRRAGPVVAALNAGINAQINSSVGSVGGTMAVPAEAWLTAGLEPKYQMYADAFGNALSTLKAAGIKLSSVSPTALVNHPAALASTQLLNFDMKQQPAALYNTVRHFQVTQDFLDEYTNALDEERQRVDPSTLTRMTDAFNSPRLAKIANGYKSVHDRLDATYLTNLPKGKQ